MPVISLFIVWRLVLFSIPLIAPWFIPYLGFFPYREDYRLFKLPGYISSLANFDGIHYVRIAGKGYDQFEQAYFPLYPLLIRRLSPLFNNNHLLTGIVIANVSFVLALFVFYYYLRLIDKQGKGKGALWAVVFLLSFPTSFFFGVLYTESLFFLLIILSLFTLEKGKPILASFFAFFASLTRLTGIFLLIPFFLKIIEKFKHAKYQMLNTKYLMLLVSPFLGLGLYSYYLYQATGDPLFFFRSQPAFGANRSTNLVLLPQVYFRYLKIFFTANINFQYLIALVEVSIFNLVCYFLLQDLLNVLKKHQSKLFYTRLGLNLFSLAILLLPTLTGTFTSVPRYVLLCPSFFIGLSQIKGRKTKIAVSFLFFVLNMVLFSFFVQGYFVS
jgi:hypothetical protein